MKQASKSMNVRDCGVLLSLSVLVSIRIADKNGQVTSEAQVRQQVTQLMGCAPGSTQMMAAPLAWPAGA